MGVRFQDLGLLLAYHLSGLEELHFGWYEPGEEPTPAGFPAAQARWSDAFLSLVPPEARSVLEVGCGTGVLLERLRARGHRVEGVEPLPDLRRRARERLGPEVPLHAVSFEGFSPPRTYDAVLMPESCQYLHRVRSLRAAAAAVAPGGWLVVADVFRVRPLDRPYLSRAGHRLEVFLDTARRSGFTLEVDQDVTERVLPTLVLYDRLLRERFLPAAESAVAWASRSFPRLRALLAPFLRRRLRLLRERYRHEDPETFRRYRTYRFLRFRRDG